MTKKDLNELVAKKGNLTNKASRDAVSAFLNGIRDSLKRGEKVVITGFGTFSVQKESMQDLVEIQKLERELLLMQEKLLDLRLEKP